MLLEERVLDDVFLESRFACGADFVLEMFVFMFFTVLFSLFMTKV